MANVLEQKLVLKTKEYSEALKGAQKEFKDAMKGMNDGLLNNSKAYAQNESQAMKWGRSVSENLKSVGKSFKDNLVTGASGLALNFGSQAINRAAKDAVAMGFSFSKAFSEIRAKSNASSQDLQRWQKQIMNIGTTTGASLDSLADSFKELFNSVGNKSELMSVMGLIGQAAAISGGDASASTDLIKQNLILQGKPVNSANVKDLLGGAQVGAMHGDFQNIDQVMKSMNDVGGVNIAKSGLSSRQLAALLSGATQTGGGRDAGTGAVKELLNSNANGILQGSIMNSLFGGAFKGGKVNVGNIVNEKSYKQLMGLGGGNENKAREMFKVYGGAAGMSDQGSDALFSMIKNFKKFNGVFEETVNETKSLEDFYKESADNLPTAYNQMVNSLIQAFTDMFKGFEDPIKKLFKGDLSGFGGLYGGTKQMVSSAVTEHPLAALGGLGVAAGGGYLLKKLLGGLGGGGGLGGVLGGGGGGPIPVYVVNAPSALGGALGGAAGAGGVLSRAGAFLGKAANVGLAGAAGYAFGDMVVNPLLDKFTSQKNQYGQTSNIVERGMAKVIPEWAGGLTSEQYQDTYGQKEVKVVVEIQSNDPAFSGVPKMQNNPRGF